MSVIRGAGSMVLGVPCRLMPGDASEDAADGHAETCEVALAKNVPGHQLSRREDVVAEALSELNLCPLIYFHPEIRERDARAQRIAVVRRRVERKRPVCLG